MKKLSMMCMAALLLLAVSCKKEKKIELGDGIGFRATAEAQGGNGKTHLDGALNVLWDMDDEIQVYSSASGYAADGLKFTATQVDGSKAGFNGETGPAPEEFYVAPYTAYYPAGMTAEGQPGQITLPATQTYAANSFARGANPMVAIAEDVELAFKNICGVLELHLQSTSACTVTNIAVTTKGDENLWGTGTVGLADPDEPTLSALADGGKTVTLNCSKADGGGVDISSEKVFRIVVPAGSLGSSFEVKLTDSDGKVWKQTATSTQNVIERNTISILTADGISTHTPVTPSSLTFTTGCIDCTYTVSGSVTVPTGGPHICEYGIVYCPTSAGHNPTIADSKITVKTEPITGKKDFTVDLPDFTAGTTYHVCAYAKIEGIVYSTVKDIVSGEVPLPLPKDWTNGRNPHPFTVGSGKVVYFSQGNLQYRAKGGSAGDAAATAASGGNVGGTWRFAEHQFDIIGCANANAAQDYEGWIDLFGWGTSGYNHGGTCYQPWSTSTTFPQYYVYSTSTYTYNLEGGPAPHTGKADWGKANAISNGGNIAGKWRTMTRAEWEYLFNTRRDGSGNLLYGEGKVGSCTTGMILLPDGWTKPAGVPNFKYGDKAWGNVYNYSEWSLMEAAGAVFLPVAGYRSGTSVLSVGSNGFCWSSTYAADLDVFDLNFHNDVVSPYNNDHRYYGFPVRLVSDN